MNTGQIITFYSYKGGVGRTMALVNIASVLTQWGKKVLMVDWDLEAPGIEPYFSKFMKTPSSNRKGVIDVLTETSTSKTKWKEYIEKIDIPNTGELHLLNSGKKSNGYHDRIRNLDIGDFYEHNSGFRIIEQLRDEWKNSYDFILIDSRTGITDNGGICTIQLPDAVVLLFTTNDQSLEGTKDVISRANRKHQSLPFDRENIITMPVVSRFDNSTEFQISQEWISKIATYLSDVFDSWIPAKVEKKEFIEKTKIPYIPYFSFGEKISVLEQGVSDPSGMGYSYESIASILANKFESLDEFLTDRSLYISRIIKGLESDIDIDRDNFSEQILNSNSFDGMLNIYKDAVSKSKLSTGIINILIERTPNFDYALKFYDDMRYQDIRPTEITFNNLISKSPNFDYAMKFYDDMRYQDIRPTEITFNNLINKSPNFDYAMKFYDDMRYQDIRPTEITFNNLINKSPNFDYAMKFYDDMRYQDIRPTEITFNNLINKSRNFEYALKFYDDMRYQNIRPSEITFNNLINKSRNFEYALKFYDDMRYQNIRPSEITFNSLIKQSPNYDYAIKFYEDMKMQRIRPSTVTYRTLANVLIKLDKAETAISLLKEEIIKDPKSVSLLIELANIYKKQEMFEEAKDLFYNVLKLSPNNKIALKEIKNLETNR